MAERVSGEDVGCMVGCMVVFAGALVAVALLVGAHNIAVAITNSAQCGPGVGPMGQP